MAAKDKESSTTSAKVRIAFWMEEDLAEKVRALAFEDHVSNSKIMSDLVRSAREPKVKRG
ncbi:hypothetical protein HZF02_32630 (plasmid) [Pseudomonas yamanorum]|nr:hypothetical protein HZF02_32630 [Pseudomonas yamanorum]